MKLNMYTVFDTASGVYDRPFFMQSDGAATRAFQDIATDAEHPIGKHPEDYHLCRIGTYDDNKGTVHPENVEVIATALELVAKARSIKPGSLKQFDEKVSEVN